MWTDYQPQEIEAVSIANNPTQSLDKDTLNLLIWNIGFAGLGEESDFFYDGGSMVHMSEEIVQKNLTGILEWLEGQGDQFDFFLFQEVDLRSTRSYQHNEVEQISAILPEYGQTFGKNYEVGFIPIPLTNPLGAVRSGISTWSKYAINSAHRHPFEGNYDWPTYLFFLDRCFLVCRYLLSDGHELVLINTHNSAYDDGTLKQTQMQQMKEVLLAEYAKGNYVIVGGDWNQFPPDFTGVPGFPQAQTSKNANLFVSDLYPSPDWQWAYDASIPTNRSLVAAFDSDTTHRTVLDFFLLSPNVEILQIQGEDLGFEYSDHNPVKLQVRLTKKEGV